jgi:hypothetical protein
MPGTLAIDAPNTFAAALLMGSAPKAKFGSTTGEISVNADGVPQYQLQVALTYLPSGPSRAAVSEVINVTVASPADPAKDITPGTPIQFDGLRCGVSEPEARENGKGIRGGKIWFTANGVRPTIFRQSKADAA